MKKENKNLTEMILDEIYARKLQMQKLSQITKSHIKPEFYDFFLNTIIINQIKDYPYDYFGMLLPNTKNFRASISQYLQGQEAIIKTDEFIIKTIKKQENIAYKNGKLASFYKKLYNIYEPIETKTPIETLPWVPYADIQKQTFSPYNEIAQYLTCENPTIVEAGAYDGKDSCLMKKKWPKSKHFAFEPIEYFYNKAKINTLLLDNYKLHKKALYSKKMQAYTIAKSDTMLLASTELTHNIKKDEQALKIEYITLDSFVEKNNIEKVNLLFLDTEGSEKHVLSGAMTTLKKYRCSLH